LLCALIAPSNANSQSANLAAQNARLQEKDEGDGLAQGRHYINSKNDSLPRCLQYFSTSFRSSPQSKKNQSSMLP
jgi:hypothetical protein